MNKELYRILNFDKTFELSLPDIINAFAAYYGVEYSEVEKKFNNVCVVGVITPEELNIKLREIRDNIFKEQLSKMLDNLGYSNEEERIKITKVLFDRYTLEWPNLIPLQKYVLYLEDRNSVTTYRKKEIVEFLKNFDKNVTIESLDELIDSGAFDNLKPILDQYKMMVGKYNEDINEFASYQEYVNKSLNLKSELEEREKDKLYLEFIDLIPQSERELSILEEKRTGHKLSFSMKVAHSIISSLSLNSIVEAFSTESDEILSKGGWRADSIKRDRISFFKNYGIDLGDDYNSYLNDERCKKLIPSEELIQKIKKRREEANTRYLNEYVNSLDSYIKIREKIDKLDLVDKNDGVNARAYLNSCGFITPNLKNNDGRYELYPILCVNLGSSVEYMDSVLLHEFNHIYELTLKEATKYGMEAVCGWDIISERYTAKKDIVSIEKSKNKREYELFNEIINEIICEEIHELMLKHGKTIINEPNSTKIYGGTSYEQIHFLVGKFYKAYGDAIKESRKNGSMKLLFDVVGEENFEALNELIHEFYDKFSEFRYYKAINDLNNKVESEEVEDIRKLILKRDEILKRMNEYSENKKRTMI